MTQAVSDLTVSVQHEFGRRAREVWRALVDPAFVEAAVQGVERVERADAASLGASRSNSRHVRVGETYVGDVHVPMGSFAPSFELHLTVEEKEYPQLVMGGGGDAEAGSFDVQLGLVVAEVRGGAVVRLDAVMDVAGDLALTGVEPVRSGMARGVERYLSGIERALARPS